MNRGGGIINISSVIKNEISVKARGVYNDGNGSKEKKGAKDDSPREKDASFIFLSWLIFPWHLNSIFINEWLNDIRFKTCLTCQFFKWKPFKIPLYKFPLSIWYFWHCKINKLSNFIIQACSILENWTGSILKMYGGN